MNKFLIEHPWLTQSWHQLNCYIDQQRIPQALLISGHKGLGKSRIATQFAKSLYCCSTDSDGFACDTCSPCKLFNAQTHPDYIKVFPEGEGKKIGVSTIRSLITRLTLKPQFDTFRVVIIQPADQLNVASANAFLKYLEEPTERTMVILIAEKPAALPATIRSRCQMVELNPPNKTQFIDWWNQHGAESTQQPIYELTSGAPFYAAQIAENGLLAIRHQFAKEWLNIVKLESNVSEVAEKWAQLDEFAMKSLFDWMITWVIDLIKIAQLNSEHHLTNPDLFALLQELADKLDLNYLYQFYDLLLLTVERLGTQLNKQLVFEDILIHWVTLNGRRENKYSAIG